MEITVLIDDVRNLKADVVFRDGNTALDEWRSLDEVMLLMLDHDLGFGPDGYDVIKSILDMPKEFWPRRVQIVSSNPVGRTRIANRLLDYGYTFSYADAIYTINELDLE